MSLIAGIGQRPAALPADAWGLPFFIIARCRAGAPAINSVPTGVGSNHE